MGRECRKRFKSCQHLNPTNTLGFQHYLHLHAALVGPHATEIESVFDTPVDELEQWQRKLVKELASKLVDEIKAKSMAYRHDNWVSFAEQNSKEPFILSTTAGEMFQVGRNIRLYFNILRVRIWFYL